ncbi:MAG: 4'-phosphopantetheinyl transferase superfamily protein [Candidatus Latescibacterota bacterium]|nr:4'-phosphopantetheinyl transferase superfamily protein [Candidatus Latescibacterota bacterium]
MHPALKVALVGATLGSVGPQLAVVDRFGLNSASVRLTMGTRSAYPCCMSTVWELPAAAPALATDEIHVWCLGLDGANADFAVLASCLSRDEHKRADRLIHERHRLRFIVARATLRRLLAQYLDLDPGAVAFAYGEHGKPALVEGGLFFNMSHSHEMALYAVAQGREVGVDVEWPRPKVAHERIAARFFSLEEQEALGELSEADRPAAFYNIWTRKEAYLKARGDGITAGLDTFSVSLGDEAALLRSDEGRDEVARWQLVTLEPEPGYVAALCAEGQWQLRCFGWSD